MLKEKHIFVEFKSFILFCNFLTFVFFLNNLLSLLGITLEPIRRVRFLLFENRMLWVLWLNMSSSFPNRRFPLLLLLMLLG